MSLRPYSEIDLHIVRHVKGDGRILQDDLDAQARDELLRPEPLGEGQAR